MVPTGIGATSLGVAAVRAAESRRADRLFDDPYARDFVAAAGTHTAMTDDVRTGPFRHVIADQVALRTLFLDERLADATEGGIRQVVILGAGMDTRAFRLPWPSEVRLFEIDLPEVHAFKEGVLAERRAVPGCDRVTVRADLAGDWRRSLLTAAFRPEQPTFWLLEGLLYALGPAGCDRLLGEVTELSAPGSELAFDHMEDSAGLREARRGIDPTLVDLWKGGPATEPGAWLATFGWRASVQDARSLADRHGRTVTQSCLLVGARMA